MKKILPEQIIEIDGEEYVHTKVFGNLKIESKISGYRDNDEVITFRCKKALFEYWKNQDILIPPWETHWFQLKEMTLLELKDGIILELMQKSIKKAGNLNVLCKELKLSAPSFYNLVNGKAEMISVKKLRRLTSYLDVPYELVNNKIKTIRKGIIPSMENPDFPINLATPEGAALLGMAVSDGCIYLDKKSRNMLRMKYAAGDDDSEDIFRTTIKQVYGTVHIQREYERNCAILKIGSSIIGETLVKCGAIIGNKTAIDDGVPWIVMLGDETLKTSYLKAAFTDEASIYCHKTKCKGFITLSRNRHIKKTNAKQRQELDLLLAKAPCRSFPTGHVLRTMTIRDVSLRIKDSLLLAELRIPTKLLQDESELLHQLGIKYRIFGSSLTRTQLGRYSLCFSLFINKKESLIKFYKYIGFSLKHKQQKLTRIVGGNNATEAV